VGDTISKGGMSTGVHTRHCSLHLQLLPNSTSVVWNSLSFNARSCRLFSTFDRVRMLKTELFDLIISFIAVQRPKYRIRINFQLMLNAAYRCPSSIDCMRRSLKQSQIEYQHQKMQYFDHIS